MGAQIDMGELGATLQTDPVEPSVSLTGARRLRRLYAMLKLLSEYQYGVLRAWYTGAGNRPAEPVVAGAHRAFYELRGRK